MAGLSGSGIDPALLATAVVLAVLGTSLGRLVLERLSDAQFRRWIRILIFLVGTACLAQGVGLAMAPLSVPR